jgi:hypothetical protein
LVYILLLDRILSALNNALRKLLAILLYLLIWIADKHGLGHMVCLFLSLLGEHLVVGELLQVLLSCHHARGVAHGLSDGLLPHLLLAFGANHVLLIANDHRLPLAVDRWIIITGLRTLEILVEGRLVDALTLIHDVSLDWRVLAASYRSLALGVHFAHLDHPRVLILLKVVILAAWGRILVQMMALGSHRGVFALLRLVLDRGPMERLVAIHRQMRILALGHQHIFLARWNILTRSEEHRVYVA